MTVSGQSYAIVDLDHGDVGMPRGCPRTLRSLAENLLRSGVGPSKVSAIFGGGAPSPAEVTFRPQRLIMQDYAGLPALLDFAGLRDDAADLGLNPCSVTPSMPVALAIDHSIIAGFSGSKDAQKRNEAAEFKQNAERFRFLKWAQSAFETVRIIPTGKGILHQINLEHLTTGVTVETRQDRRWIVPDSLLGTDSHSTMVGGLGVLGWGVGGIEATSCLLGDGVCLQWPKVVGVRVSGKRRPHVQAADIVLHLTNALRAQGVVECFVEFTGVGLDQLSVADRATLANMAPEYGATVAFFPTDAKTLEHFELVGRDPHHVALIEAYARAQGLWHDPGYADPIFETTIELDLCEIGTTFAGPARPDQALSPAQTPALFAKTSRQMAPETPLRDGDIVLAAITSCTNTSNPAAMITAGLVARKAVSFGLSIAPRIKTTFAPGSQVVRCYLDSSGLMESLDALGFGIAGFGCMTCVGNTGPLAVGVQAEIEARGTVACAVLSGNRNFEGRIHKAIKSSFLMSPAHVIAAAIAGHMRLDLERDVLARQADGTGIRLRDLWPSEADIKDIAQRHIRSEDYQRIYANIDQGNAAWRAIEAPKGATYEWDPDSRYIRRPPAGQEVVNTGEIKHARPLLHLGDNVTTDHISPVGAIDANSPAGRYLLDHGIPRTAFNTYGARRGDHNVMLRGTFANPRLANRFVHGRTGGWTLGPDGKTITTVHAAAVAFAQSKTATVICAGHAYGAGSAGDWAAKGVAGLGVQAVIARSFERIHRTNLVLCGVLPLVLPDSLDWMTLGLEATDRITLRPKTELAVGCEVIIMVERAKALRHRFSVECAIRTQEELLQYRAGGVLAQRRAEMKKSSHRT